MVISEPWQRKPPLSARCTASICNWLWLTDLHGKLGRSRAHFNLPRGTEAMHEISIQSIGGRKGDFHGTAPTFCPDFPDAASVLLPARGAGRRCNLQGTV